jgi:hypothetical protein
MEPLCPLISTFSYSLSVCAPYNMSVRDCRGWGDSTYQVKDIYLSLLASLPMPQCSLFGSIFGTMMGPLKLIPYVGS